MAVHPDGTIFTVQGLDTPDVSVVGINPITGAQIFSVPLAVDFGILIWPSSAVYFGPPR